MRSIAFGWTCKRGSKDKRGGRKICRDRAARAAGRKAAHTVIDPIEIYTEIDGGT